MIVLIPWIDSYLYPKHKLKLAKYMGISIAVRSIAQQ